MASKDQVNSGHSDELPARSSKVVNSANEISVQETPSYYTCSLFDSEQLKCLLSGAVLARCTPSAEQDLYGSCEPPEERQTSPVSRDLIVPRKMACSVCTVDFSCRADQIQHYKLDWHRFNLKEKLKGNAPISEAVFDEQSGDISSLSGSDSESESRTGSDMSSSPRHKTRPSAVPEYLRATNEQPSKSSENSSETDDTDDVSPKSTRMQPKVYFQNDSGKVIGLYRCVIHSKQNSPPTKEALVKMLNRIPEESTWAVILVGGGHFAAAILECSTVVEHKTFHRYTVRAKQGSSQGARDGRQGGQNFNSAGASLRRYNESALIKDIQDLLSTWSSKLQSCHRIFYRAPSFNRSILFGGKNPPFRKDDARLRTIPFPTRRATYAEVRRVHSVLSILECFGDSASYKESLPVSPKVHLGSRKKKNPPCADEVLAFRDGNINSKESSVSNSPRSIRNKKEEESCTVEHDGAPALSSKEELLPVVKEPEEFFSSSSTNPANSTSNECDEPDLNGSEETPICEVKEFKVSVPLKKKKERKRANVLFKRQKDPDTNATADEKYQMKNSLYDACKAGNVDEIQKLLDIIACPKKPFIELNPGNSTFSTMQSYITHNEDFSAETTDFSVPCSKSITANPSTSGPLSNVNVIANVPSRNASRAACVIDTSSHEERTKVRARERRHSFAEYKNSCDIISLASDLDGCTSSSNSTTHSRCGSVPSSPRAQQNKKQRSHSLSSKDDSIPIVFSASILNEKINDEGTTLLHVATKEGHYSVVQTLLKSGADPTVRNRKGLTPYMVSSDKEMRNVYRRFMASHPEHYDYNKAQIPSPLTEAQEAEKLEKSKEKKKLKKAKMKEKKILAAELKKEEEEKQRFLSLSDREKRAVAAEKRYVQQLLSQPSHKNHPVLSRCFSCGTDITAKTPFEYLDYVFCSVACVKQHRTKASS